VALSITVAFGAGGATVGNAQAEEWPTRYVTMVVPFAAGSSSDAVGRIIGARLSELLGQQIVVENAGGAGGTIGTTRVVKARPDGYTFSLGSLDTLALAQSLYRKPAYNALTDLTPVALVGDMSLYLVIRNGIPATNLQQFVAYAKENGGKMQFGSSGLGSSSHLTCSQFSRLVNPKIAQVAYRGAGPALQDLIAGQIDFFCSLAAAAMPHIQNKLLRPIAVLGKERSPFLPDLPTAREQGVEMIDSYAWTAIAFPKGVSPEIVDKLAKAISDALDTPSVQQRMKNVAVVPAAKERRSPAYLKALMETEVARWATIIKSSGVVLN
jgi:tripartite-type tricarboxylate transporter receptor subunit TctC